MQFVFCLIYWNSSEASLGRNKFQVKFYGIFCIQPISWLRHFASSNIFKVNNKMMKKYSRKTETKGRLYHNEIFTIASKWRRWTKTKIVDGFVQPKTLIYPEDMYVRLWRKTHWSIIATVKWIVISISNGIFIVLFNIKCLKFRLEPFQKCDNNPSNEKENVFAN